MKKCILLSIMILCLGSCAKKEAEYMGSRSCRDCHENFYELWETSRHGRAMQAFTAAFADSNLTPCDTFIRSGDRYFRYVRKGDEGRMVTPEGQHYPVRYALGGKYVYYFLTPLDKGKLQTLPLGYDTDTESWFDITASSIRVHAEAEDRALDWKDRRYTFNTACFSCHVSQLSTAYDLQEDSYETEWREAGINCETCHGPAEKHNRVYLRAEKTGRTPPETHLEVVMQDRGYGPEEVNATCSYCHAKMISLTPEYVPGESFFRHFDLVTFEDPDYYPDGRDLGENYTFTSWRMSPCVQNSDMDCMHCHTSSGRYRQKEDPNRSCLPCHAERVAQAPEHSFHPEGSPGNICINCHLPKTEFARMTRSDHSMRPPMPAATEAYGSPNACNICHTGRTPAWADSVVRTRYTGRFQRETLEWASYIHDLRSGDGKSLTAALDFLLRPENAIVRTSIVRCLDGYRDAAIPDVLLELLGDASPLLRSAAAAGLRPYAADPRVREGLMRAAGDDILLVRVRAAEALADMDPREIPRKYRRDVRSATEELKRSLKLFPDSEISHYNYAHFLERRQRSGEAAAAYRQALELRPEYAEAAVNLGMLYYEQGKRDSAEHYFRHAVRENPEQLPAYINLGMLYAERGDTQAAVETFRSAWRVRGNADAAYNLAVLYDGRDADSSLFWARRARDLEEGDPKYAYTYAFYLTQNGESASAVEVLEKALEEDAVSFDIYYLLASLYRNSGDTAAFRKLRERAAGDVRLRAGEREIFRK